MANFVLKTNQKAMTIKDIQRKNQLGDNLFSPSSEFGVLRNAGATLRKTGYIAASRACRKLVATLVYVLTMSAYLLLSLFLLVGCLILFYDYKKIIMN